MGKKEGEKKKNIREIGDHKGHGVVRSYCFHSHSSSAGIAKSGAGQVILLKMIHALHSIGQTGRHLFP